MPQAPPEIDPFSTRMIFLRIGWMNRYQGKTGGDQITGGGAFVEQHGYGHEIFNYQPFEGRVYGYVQPTGSGHNLPQGPGISITRLGAATDDDSISGVLTVWVATSPQGGMYVVGWYVNATVHRHWQTPPPESNRNHAGEGFGYYVTASSENATLLPPDERLLGFPHGKGGMGQSNVFYADDPEQHLQIRSDVLNFIATRQLPGQSFASESGTPKQADPFLRQKVEHAAVATTTEYYRGLGYKVESVEKDNVGWDLDAVFGQRQLRLEVKGLSGSKISVELTPNEYDKMQAHRDSYRVCVVTNALNSPDLSVFAYSQESGAWEDRDGQILHVDEIVAARCTI